MINVNGSTKMKEDREHRHYGLDRSAVMENWLKAAPGRCMERA